MSRERMLRRLAEEATRPLGDFMRQPAGASLAAVDAAPPEIYVWFENTAMRRRGGGRGIAGLPECLLPYACGMRVLEHRYADGHVHLLAAARIQCHERFGECIAALYTAALSIGTIAWIGTGAQYAKAWREMYS